jgi:spore germination protein KC
MNLHHFLTAMNTPGIEPAVTAIHLLKRLHDDENKDGFIAEGAAVFKKDRLAGWLDRTETRGVNWINGRVVSGILAVQSPVDHSKRVSVEIVRSDSTITPEYKNGRLSVTVEIRMEGTLGEQLSGSAMAIPEQVEELQKHVNDQILKEAGSALAAAQDKYKTDVFGFGREVSRRIPKLWKELDGRWEDEFSQLHVIVRVESKIRATGLASDPVRPD